MVGITITHHRGDLAGPSELRGAPGLRLEDRVRTKQRT